MFPQTEVAIQGTQYRLTHLPSALGRPMLLRLSKLCATGADHAALVGSEAALVTGALLALDAAELDAWWEKFEARTEVMAEHGYVLLSIKYPKDAGGLMDYALMFELMEAHVRANFGGFFETALAKWRALITEKAGSKSPKS